MADPRLQYQDDLQAYGLGLGGIGPENKIGLERSPFAEEGPSSMGFDFESGLGPDDPLAGLTREESMDYLGSMGIDLENPVLGLQELVERAAGRPETVLENIPSDVSNFGEFANAYGDVMSAIESGPTATSRALNLEEMQAALSANPSVMDLEGSEGLLELDDIDSTLAEISATQAIDRKMNADNIMPSQEQAPITQEQTEEGFLAAMDDFFEAARGAGPAVPEERTIEEYKRAFSEATGIDTSGKVDKKDALMAFGLALMQNKAGKGFNVGKMLTSVGEAGDKAMPALQRAKNLAREGALAGGKYALQTQATDEAKRTAGAEAAMNRSQYWVYERGEPGAEFAGFDKGQIVPLSKYELNKLINDPAFESQYEFISAADRMDVLAKRAEGQDFGDAWGSKFEQVSLVGGDWKDQPAALVVNGVSANPNYGGTAPSKYKLGEDESALVNRFIGYQNGIDKDRDTFEGLIANIEAGVSIPEQAYDKVTGFFRAIGYTPADGMPSDTAQAKQALANFSIDNATDILKESGKTLSDGDRKLVSERVGKIDFFNSDPALILNQVRDIYNFTVVKAQNNLDSAIESLDKNFGISISPQQNDMPTQAELDAMNTANNTNLTLEDFR